MSTFRIREGIIGGVIAGMVMAMVAMLYALVAEGDMFAPLKQMGALFFPHDSGSAASLVSGLMLHMMMAAIFGGVFVLLARSVASVWGIRGIGASQSAVAGMVYILGEWAIASFLILPAIDPALLPTFASIGGVLAHAMCGVVLGWWLAVRREPVSVRARGGLHGQAA